jgi:hypothetical protein
MPIAVAYAQPFDWIESQSCRELRNGSYWNVGFWHTFEGLLKIEKDTENSIMLRGDIERTKDALKLIFTKYCLPTSR